MFISLETFSEQILVRETFPSRAMKNYRLQFWNNPEPAVRTLRKANEMKAGGTPMLLQVRYGNLSY